MPMRPSYKMHLPIFCLNQLTINELRSAWLICPLYLLRSIDSSIICSSCLHYTQLLVRYKFNFRKKFLQEHHHLSLERRTSSVRFPPSACANDLSFECRKTIGGVNNLTNACPYEESVCFCLRCIYREQCKNAWSYALLSIKIEWPWKG